MKPHKVSAFSAFDGTGAAGAGRVRYRLRANPSYTAASATVELVQGATVVASWSHTAAAGTLPTVEGASGLGDRLEPNFADQDDHLEANPCLLYTSPSPRD